MLGIKKDKTEIDFEIIKEKKTEAELILDKLNNYLCLHIENQINAGAEVIQIFDSWAGLLIKNDLPKFCYGPNLKIVDFCKKKKYQLYVFQKVLKKITKNLIIS